MAAKSIIDIDLKDEKFRAFHKLFEKYRESVKAMPGDWANVGTATGKAATTAAKGFQEEAASIAAMSAALAHVVKSQSEIERKAKTSNTAFKDVARTTGTIAKNVANTTFQLLKWAALGGIVGAATGFFGADALAGSASNLRKTAQGLTVTPGQLRAAKLDFGNYIDPESVLGNISSMQSDLSQRGYLARFGITGSKLSENPGQLLPELLPRLVQMFKSGGGTQQIYQAYGMDKLIDLPSLKRLSNLPKGELQGAINQYGRDTRSTSVGDRSLRSLQLLSNQFQRAGILIENVFIRGLTRLAPNLEHLSGAIVSALQTIASSPATAKAIDSIGKGLEEGAKYLTSPSFKSDVQDFVSLVHQLAHPIDSAGGYFGSAFNSFANTPIIPGTHSFSLADIGTTAVNAYMDINDWAQNKKRERVESDRKKGWADSYVLKRPDTNSSSNTSGASQNYVTKSGPGYSGGALHINITNPAGSNVNVNASQLGVPH